MKRTFLMLFMVGAAIVSMAQTTRVVKGFVVDENGNPLSGAKIEAKGADEGTVTDADGAYELELNKKQKAFLAQYQGYAPVVVRIKPNVSNMVVWMDPIKDYNRWVSKRYWPSPFYMKILLGISNFPSKANFSSTGNFSYAIELGGTVYLHKKPVADALKFGIDASFKLSPEIYIDDNFSSQMHETFSIGPSVWYAPFTKSPKARLSVLGFSALYHVGYGWGQLNQKYRTDDIHGSGLKHSVGIGLYYKRMRFGFEHEWRNMKYDGDRIKSSANYFSYGCDLGRRGTAGKSLKKAIRDKKQRNNMVKAVADNPQPTKTIHGVVTDEMGNPISGALVEATGGAENTYTAQDGTFTLEVSKWLLSATASYGNSKQTLKLDGTSSLHFKIKEKKN